MLDNLGICKGAGNILADIRIGSDIMTIQKIGCYFYTMINDRVILKAKSEKNLITKVQPVLSVIIKKMAKRAQLDAVRWKPVDKNYTEMIDKVLKGIDKDLKKVEIFVLKVKPDEIQDNKTIGYQASKSNIIDRLENYKQDLKNLAEVIENIRHASQVLLKIDLDKTIWGSKNVMNIFNNIKLSFNELPFEKADYYLENSGNNVSKLQFLLYNKVVSEHIKDVVSKIIKNFSLLKSFISELIQRLHKLYVIDDAFKTHMEYPATWFLDNSVFMDFLFEYENLINYLIKLAHVETTIIEPLFVKKLTGV